MDIIQNFLLVIQVVSAISMIGLILLQQGKGAEMGAAFGSGSAGSLFGTTGGATFMSRTTSILATIFFVCTLGLAYLGNLKPMTAGSVLSNTKTPSAVTAPATPSSQVTPTTPPATGATQIPAK